MSLKTIFDRDPGNDDALAILAAAGHAGLDLAAVTTVAGHLAGERTARNAARMMALAAPLSRTGFSRIQGPAPKGTHDCRYSRS